MFYRIYLPHPWRISRDYTKLSSHNILRKSLILVSKTQFPVWTTSIQSDKHFTLQCKILPCSSHQGCVPALKIYSRAEQPTFFLILFLSPLHPTHSAASGSSKVWAGELLREEWRSNRCFSYMELLRVLSWLSSLGENSKYWLSFGTSMASPAGHL